MIKNEFETDSSKRGIENQKWKNLKKIFYHVYKKNSIRLQGQVKTLKVSTTSRRKYFTLK